MKLKKYIKQNSGVIGIIVGILGIIVGGCISFYFYKKSITKPEPILITDPSRTLIVNAEHFSDTPLKIVRLNGNEVAGNITALRFYFWNNGNKSIKTSNILEPINISLSDPNAIILDYKILKTSRKVVAPEFVRNIESLENELSISFGILEKNDGLTGQLIYSGNPKADLIVSGTIEGAKEILTDSLLVQRRLRTEFLPIVFLLLAAMAILIDWLLHRKRISNAKLVKKPGGWIVLGILISVFASVLLTNYEDTVERAKSNTMIKAIKNVPENIIP